MTAPDIDDDPDLKAGRELATLLLPMIQDGANDALDTRQYWAGFIAAVVGWASVSTDLRSLLRGIATEVEQNCPPINELNPEKVAH